MILRVILGICLVGATSWASSPVADLVEQVAPGVVNLQATSIQETISIDSDDFFFFLCFFNFFGLPTIRRPQKAVSRGSGLMIDKEGYLVTNYHVIEGAEEVIAILENKTQLKTKVIGYDRKYDIALLKVEESKAYAALKLGDSDKVRIGEDVIAIGNPFGLQHTVTKGIISSKHRTIGAGPFDDFLQTDASINPGNSGGPIFNEKGEVIGISTAIKSSAQGIGFAIPINVVKDIVVQLKKYGRVLRQWLGIVGDNVSSYMPSYVGGYRKGVIIINMVQGSPADRQGLQIGDIILEANKQPISDVYDLQRIIEKRENKEKTSEILLKIVRNGKSAMIKTIPLEIIPKEEKLPRGHQFI